MRNSRREFPKFREGLLSLVYLFRRFISVVNGRATQGLDLHPCLFMDGNLATEYCAQQFSCYRKHFLLQALLNPVVAVKLFQYLGVISSVGSVWLKFRKAL
jgi:hypothetical protein